MRKSQTEKRITLNPGDIVHGKKILKIEYKPAPHGRSLRFITMACSCRSLFEMNYQTVAMATKNAKIRLCCDPCKAPAQPEPKRLAESRETSLAAETLKLIGALTPSELDEATRIVVEHVRACRKAGSAVESINRAFIEAAEMVKINHRLPVTEWTRENRAEGLKIRSYPQYQGGFGVI